MTESADELWYYDHNNKCSGPIVRSAVLDLIHRNVIRADTFVCLPPGDWIPAGKSALAAEFPGDQLRIVESSVISPVTSILLANIAVYVMMAFSGAGVSNPAASALLRWGASYGPRTSNGEWWRLFTCTFVHIGLLHIAFNMLALFQIGPQVQKLLGRSGFMIVYLVSGLAGAMASLYWNPYVISAGASGAIFGLYGALFGLSVVERKKANAYIAINLAVSGIFFVGYNIYYGLTHDGIDMAAHIGGLAAGYICAYCLNYSPSPEGVRNPVLRMATVTLASAVVLVIGIAGAPHAFDVQSELKHMSEVEKSSVSKFNGALAGLRSGKMKPLDAANIVEKDVLPDWIAERDSISKVKGLPQKQEQLIESLIKYMDLRRESWTDFAAGLRGNNQAMLEKATQKQHEAEKVIRDLGAPGKSR